VREQVAEQVAGTLHSTSTCANKWLAPPRARTSGWHPAANKWLAPSSSTLLQFQDTPFGRLTEKMTRDMQEGWRYLLEDVLKPYCEG
jgi:hypothetical protein